MPISFRNSQKLRAGDKIEVYYNSFKERYSIRSLESDHEMDYGKVIADADYLQMQDVNFLVRQSQDLRRVILRGIYAGSMPIPVLDAFEVAYDNDRDTFLHATEGEIKKAGYVTVYNHKIGAEKGMN